MTFETLGLCPPILKAIKEKGYNTPSPIQAKAIPAILKGHDLMAAAQTGTGKTAGFTLPLLHRLAQGEPVKRHHIRALILTPTRELAAQVADSVATYGKHLSIKSAVVFGGVKINPQITTLRRGVDILIATPGRLLDLYEQKAFNVNDLDTLILDEADRMLDMGFIRDIKKIMAILPKKRQNLLFSATFSKEIRTLAKGLVVNPTEVSVSPPNSTVDTIKQQVHPVDKNKKSALLAHLIHSGKWDQVLVFTRTKHGANRLVKQLADQRIYALAIHGNKSQAARTKALSEFKQGEVRVLVATDIAARGLDIDLLPHVVNFDLPQVAEDYVHRIGRTGRAGAKGEAISLVSADECKQLSAIERLIKKKLPKNSIEGFEPDHTLPISKTAVTQEKPQKKYHGAKKNNGKKTPRKNTTPSTRHKSRTQQTTANTSRPKKKRTIRQSTTTA